MAGAVADMTRSEISVTERGSVAMKTEVARTMTGLGLTDADVALVRTRSALLADRLDRLVDDFYVHLLAGPAAERLAGIDVERLRRSQKEHWSRLFADGIDDDYVRRVTRIGIVHRERRIDPPIYMQGYGWIAARLAADLAGDADLDAAERGPLVAAVLRLVMLDMSTALLAWQASLID